LQNQLDSEAKGTTGYAAVKPKILFGAVIPLPPLDEQRRIVARIEELAARIGEARRLRRQTLEESDALLSHLGKRSFSRDRKAEKKQLKDITTRITKGESPGWQGFAYQDEGPVFVRSENVLWGKLDLSKRVCIPKEFHKKLNRSLLHPGDVLINLVGASIGRTCVVPDGLGEANINQAVAVISPEFELLDSKYLMHFLMSPSTQEIIHRKKVETARPNISLGDLRSLTLPVPHLIEQQRIVAYLEDLMSKIDAHHHLQMDSTHELDVLLIAVLNRAFMGGL